jgi:hypothetical protein
MDSMAGSGRHLIWSTAQESEGLYFKSGDDRYG